MIVPTTFAAAALSVLVSAETVSTLPVWQPSYTAALTAAVAQQKPVAVFIGSGSAGYSRLVSGGEFPAEAGRLLNAHYVCVYVDTDTAAGKELAGEFGLTSGLVISGKGGKLQALRHVGTVAPADLTGYLTKYGDPTRTVTSTETGGVVLTSATVSGGAVVGGLVGGCPNGRCPTATYAPTYGTPVYGSPVYGGAVQPAGYPFVTGGCPNGRCPNAR